MLGRGFYSTRAKPPKPPFGDSLDWVRFALSIPRYDISRHFATFPDIPRHPERLEIIAADRNISGVFGCRLVAVICSLT